MRANESATPRRLWRGQNREGMISNIGDFGRHLYQQVRMMCGFMAPHSIYR
jgi:hypothetical protein